MPACHSVSCVVGGSAGHSTERAIMMREIAPSSSLEPATRRQTIFRDDLLVGRVAIVTGGSSGIGLGIVRVFSELGSAVAIVGRQEAKLQTAKLEIMQHVPKARIATFATDVRDDAAMRAMVDQVTDRFGHLDILVNNAAGNFHCPTEQLSPNGWRTVVDIDLHGTFNGCQAALPALKASRFGGRIVNITVPQALSGWPGSAHASAAKAGILSLTRSLSVEWGGYGIRINNVLPGPIAGTEGLKRLYEDRGIADRERERIALGEFGMTDDIANACAFLCSAGGDFVTGCDFIVDGGRWLKRAWV
jgi:NAD(P)-dependent dehydrogenase (short-subunit alcohol dehydrogenase family)